MDINWKPTLKQYEAWEILNDKTTTELLWGGASSGGKTYFGCCWLIISCLKYPGSRHLMGRSKLNTLKSTTLKTFNDIIKSWNLTDRVNINNQNNTIYFDNGSEILMKDLFAYPADENFDSLGSLEVTSVFCDEMSQISYKAFEIIQTRIRYKLKEFGLIPKLLMTCNPSKGYLYTEFYKPWKEDKLNSYRKFMPVLATDNPYTDSNYIQQLMKASEATKQRLLYGNWDYSSDSDSLFRYQDLIKMKVFDYTPSKSRYISADIARLGKDTTIIMIWDGFTIVKIVQLEQVTTNISVDKIRSLSIEYNIPIDNVIIDADGVGGGVVDNLPGVKSFINNSRPIDTPSPNVYQNLKSQCYYKLAELVEKCEIFTVISNEDFETICQELQVIKQKDYDKDGKLAVIPKEQMKKILGRSPDFADAMCMRMFYELRTVVSDWSLLF